MTKFDGESVVVSYKSIPGVTILFAVLYALFAFVYLLLISQGRLKAAYNPGVLAGPAILSALILLSYRTQSNSAIFITANQAIYRPAWGRLQRMPFKDITRMWLTRVDITSFMQTKGQREIVDGLGILTPRRQDPHLALTFGNKEDLYARLTQSTNLKIEPLAKNDYGHGILGP